MSNNVLIGNIITEKTHIVSTLGSSRTESIDDKTSLKVLKNFPDKVRSIEIGSYSEIKSPDSSTKLEVCLMVGLSRSGETTNQLYVDITCAIIGTYDGHHVHTKYSPYNKIHLTDSSPLGGTIEYDGTGIRTTYSFENGMGEFPHELTKFLMDPKNLYATDESLVDHIIYVLSNKDKYNLRGDYDIPNRDILMNYDIYHNVTYRYLIEKTLTSEHLIKE